MTYYNHIKDLVQRSDQFKGNGIGSIYHIVNYYGADSLIQKLNNVINAGGIGDLLRFEDEENSEKNIIGVYLVIDDSPAVQDV